MRLVPRQLQRHGMTGRVPYYGGRLTPDQAYAAAHPTQPPPPRSWTPRFGPPPPLDARGGTPPPAGAAPGGSPVPPEARTVATRTPDEQRATLQALRDKGVLTDEEHAALSGQLPG